MRKMSHTTTKICAALFATGLLLAGLADNLRPWRRLQVEFYALELESTKTRLAAVRERLTPRLDMERNAVREERQRFTEQRPESIRLEEGLRTLRGREERARMRLQETRYALAVAHQPGAEEAARERLKTALRERRRELEAWREEIAVQEKALHNLGAALAAAEGREEALNAELRPLEERLRELQRGASRRTWPLLGLFDPLVATEEVTLQDLPLLVPHSGAPRVDRCLTCHRGAQRHGFDEVPAPFGSHPRLDLFVSEGSAHPYAEVGCTICHGGEGRATAFDRAGHLPRDAAQEATWRQQWGYRPEHLPAQPILPSALVEAGCAACHQAQGETLAASTLDTGRRLSQRLGCGACHPALAETPGLPKRGPSLLRLASKTRPSWTARFLQDPKAFRPTTWMPHGFDSEGTDQGQRMRQAAEINAVVTYLFEHSQATALEPAPSGVSEAGRALWNRVGCTACHLLDPQATRDAYAPGFERLQGPHLAGMGSKAEADWLYAWLRDPRGHRSDTPMPNLRLDAEEAAAITAFLIAQQDNGWESTWQNRGLPPIDPAVRDGLVLEHLEQALPLRQSAARFEAMGQGERTLYLGERTLAQHGCHGCHAIPGFEDRPPPNVPLPHLAPQTAISWLDDASSGFHRTDDDPKPQRPTSGPDATTVKASVKAPRYDLSLGERTALATWLLASQMPEAPAHFPQVNPALVAGQRLIQHYGCRGCHSIAGRGGFSDLEGRPQQTPPALISEGRRVRPSWLLSFLRNPGEHPVRPWLHIRMPRFALSDPQFATLTRYFIEVDGASLLEAPARPASTTEETVGAVYFDVLQCGRCHDGQEDSGGLQVPQFAPSYQLARQRLRMPWVLEWILDPTGHDPQTSMPALVGDENDPSFLLRSLNAPMFINHKAQLQRVLKDEEALADFLADPERVAQSLCAHLWSLGEEESVR